MNNLDLYHSNKSTEKRNDSRHRSNHDFLSQKKETKTFLDTLAEKTAREITVTFLKYPEEEGKSPKGYVLNNRIPFKIEEAFSLLEKENAWYKNVAYGYSVLWAFSRENQYFNVVIIDDIEDTETFKLRDHFLLWNTSTKYQAAFLLDQGVTSEEVKKIQRMLIKAYGGDHGSIGAAHNKKMPGFYNTKYKDDPPYMQLEHVGTRVLETRYILQKYEKAFGKDHKEQEKKEIQQPTLTAQQVLSQLTHTHNRTWQDFMRDRGNHSQADVAYAIYLIARGYTNEQVEQALLFESENIETRKKGHLEDYLGRTIMAARRYCETHHKER